MRWLLGSLPRSGRGAGRRANAGATPPAAAPPPRFSRSLSRQADRAGTAVRRSAADDRPVALGPARDARRQPAGDGRRTRVDHAPLQPRPIPGHAGRRDADRRRRCQRPLQPARPSTACSASSSPARSVSRQGLLRDTIADRYGATPSDRARGRRRPHARSALSGQRLPRGRRSRPDRVAPDPAAPSWCSTSTPASRATIADVTVEGDPQTTRDAFLRQLQAQKGDPYEAADAPAPPGRLRAEAAKARLLRGGSQAQRATISEDRTTVDLALTVQPGPRRHGALRG